MDDEPAKDKLDFEKTRKDLNAGIADQKETKPPPVTKEETSVAKLIKENVPEIKMKTENEIKLEPKEELQEIHPQVNSNAIIMNTSVANGIETTITSNELSSSQSKITVIPEKDSKSCETNSPVTNSTVKVEPSAPIQNKTRDEVSRVLNFNNVDEVKTVADAVLKTKDCKDTVISNNHSSLTLAKEKSSSVSHSKSHTSATTMAMATNSTTMPSPAIKQLSSTTSSNNHHSSTSSSSSSSRKSSYISGSSSHHHHKSSSSSSKYSSSSSSRDRECSKCYKRSKIRRNSVGTQCIQYAPTAAINPSGAIERRDSRPPAGLEHLKYGHFFQIEIYPNGGASVVHLYQDEIASLCPEEMEELVNEFFSICFAEDEQGYAHHVMGIVHDSAKYLPDLLEHMADNYSTLTVKAGVLGRNSDIETCTMSQYNDQVGGKIINKLEFLKCLQIKFRLYATIAKVLFAMDLCIKLA